MFFLFEIITLIAALSITSASTIEGHNIVHEENCEGQDKMKAQKCAPPANVYVTASSMLLMRAPEPDDEDCSVNMIVFCPACKEEGKIMRCQKIEDGYMYIIDHNGRVDVCTIIEQHERDQVLTQIKFQRDQITNICLRYLCSYDQSILDELFIDLRDV